ncbi:MAG: hypothetical protein AAFY29_01595 [Pseudomonadota bacterium]
MKLKLPLLLPSILVISGGPGCASRIDDAVLNRITECGAGYSLNLGATLSAKLEENIRDGVSVDTGIEDELKATFINSADVSEDNAVQLYDSYLSCLNKRL